MAFRRLEQGQSEQPILLAEPYRQLLEATPSAALAFDQQGNIIASNAHVEKMFGYTQAELLGQGFEFLLPVRLRKFNRLERLSTKSLF